LPIWLSKNALVRGAGTRERTGIEYSRRFEESFGGGGEGGDAMKKARVTIA
jgi:hypothetical protein